MQIEAYLITRRITITLNVACGEFIYIQLVLPNQIILRLFKMCINPNNCKGKIQNAIGDIIQ